MFSLFFNEETAYLEGGSKFVEMSIKEAKDIFKQLELPPNTWGISYSNLEGKTRLNCDLVSYNISGEKLDLFLSFEKLLEESGCFLQPLEEEDGDEKHVPVQYTGNEEEDQFFNWLIPLLPKSKPLKMPPPSKYLLHLAWLTAEAHQKCLKELGIDDKNLT